MCFFCCGRNLERCDGAAEPVHLLGREATLEAVLLLDQLLLPLVVVVVFVLAARNGMLLAALN